ncbi:tetratricopeptide repeat protein [Streptomyces noursei]|uniref:tetratricopeptide repeat protein n=1 Tax=Streptomyces noursei TaxID=1971 RepID=UPI003808BC5F
MADTPPAGSEPGAVEHMALSELADRGRLRMRAHAARMFNNGLAAARNGRPDLARDFFAACVLWYPHDLDARSALALACLESGDPNTAREHWEQVLDQHPGDLKALRGLDSPAVRSAAPAD